MQWLKDYRSYGVSRLSTFFLSAFLNLSLGTAPNQSQRFVMSDR